jgi:hypothetical protein
MEPSIKGIAIAEPLIKIIDKIASGNMPPPQVTMKYEMLRFATFRTYPKEDKPYIMLYSKAGFYYAANTDVVICYVCGLRRSTWASYDKPIEIHKQINPTCDFLVKNSTVNISNTPWSVFFDVSINISDIIPIPRELDYEHNVVLPKNPEYADIENRKKSFSVDGKPMEFKVPIEDLIKAGLFYAGFGDCVRCFYCGIGLRHWADEDDPMIEHARWSKDCIFLKRFMGDEFISLVQLAVSYTRDNTPLCLVCKTNPATISYLPCMHNSVCENCKEINKDCPLCCIKSRGYFSQK